eukprot:CAMPEP_0181228158 /NCGR_PEP_ID=MMETSP1096-20121128/33198_1 /TAXON_ID=156174 ORGANISM="Chrysochromulina ericina, Strain CCMP281" /NCGR_SAMPLE_ID=MMETSP1096 /ASSEMBLY_ACC=CAM_ASM_000453 /LENGTH=197 /DNA_ID=CAMNT_0023321663 /DNA_START=1676 /DNA_END=2270 /DNA_ORIENTATION=-
MSARSPLPAQPPPPDACAQGDLQRGNEEVALEQRVHARLRVCTGGHRVEDCQPAVGLVEIGVERPPLSEQPTVEDGGWLLLRLAECVRHFVRCERPIPNADLGDVPFEVAVDILPAELGTDEHWGHLVGELSARLGGRGEPAIHVQPHCAAVVSGVELMPFVGGDWMSREDIPRLYLTVKERSQVGVKPQSVLTTEA